MVGHTGIRIVRVIGRITAVNAGIVAVAVAVRCPASGRVYIRVAAVQRVGAVGRLVNVCVAVAVAVAVGVIGIHIIGVGHAVVVIIGVVFVRQAVLVVITSTNGMVGHTGIRIVRVISWIQGVHIGYIAVVVIVNKVAISLSWRRVTGVERIGAVGGFINIRDTVFVGVTVGIQRTDIVGIGNTIGIVVRVFAVNEAVAVKVAMGSSCNRIAIIQRVGAVGGLLYIGDAILVAVAVRVVGIGIINIGHAIAVVIVVIGVDHAIVVEITPTNSYIRDAGVVIVRVVGWVQRVGIREKAVAIVVR